jgi:hypothetical protein
LFPNICDLKKIRIKACIAHTAPEGLTVIVRRTSSDHNAIEVVFANGFLDLLLALQRTEVLIRAYNVGAFEILI